MVTFIGPVALAGIGQVMRKYANLIGGKYIEYGQPLDNTNVAVAFVLPIPDIISILKTYSAKCKKVIYLTICETETVHELYESIFELDDTFYVASQFCSDILKRQFPQGEFPVMHLYAYPPKELKPFDLQVDNKYVFYHIGNIMDHRKNTKKLIECFMRANLSDSVLVLKATCRGVVDLKIPNVVIINGLLSEEQLEYIHHVGDCYVSMAFSEGAGMGAIEAAMRHKPVIFPDYGATKEYVDTDWLVPTGRTTVGMDDFLFKKDFVWGDPDPSVMIEHMKDVYSKRPTVLHQKTYDIMAKVPLDLMNKILE